MSTHNVSHNTVDLQGIFSKPRAKTLLPVILVMVWPMLYYFRYVITGPYSLAIGNDFYCLYYSYKAYLINLLSSGFLPLWSPSEAAGYPFWTNPFTQFFYPLNLPAVIFSKIFGGYSAADHQRYTVLGISILSLGLYCWLYKLSANSRAALFATLISACSFKIAELLRFPNAIHAAAWMPWLLYGMTLALFPKRRLVSCSVLFMAAFMILTAGYPYYIYYCFLFLLPPYFVIMAVPCLRRTVFSVQPSETVRPFTFFIRIALPLLAAILICSPYIYKMRGLMSESADRGGGNYDYATALTFGPTDTIGSLIFPPVASPEGWYYFSIMGVLLLSLLCVSSLIASFSVPPRRRFLLLIAMWFGLVSLVSYGKSSLLFDLLWHYVPGFNQLRVWGRLNIILLPIIALALAKAYENFEQLLSQRATECERRPLILRLIITVLFSGFVIGVVQYSIFTGGAYHSYWLEYFKHLGGTERLFLISTAVASFSLVAAALYFLRRPPTQRQLRWVVGILVSVAVIDLYTVGSRQWITGGGVSDERQALQIRQAIAESVETPRINEYRTIALGSTYNVGCVENWYYGRYIDFRKRVFSTCSGADVSNREELAAFERLMGMSNGGQRIFLSENIHYPTIRQFIEDSEKIEQQLNHKPAIRFYDGGTIQIEVSNSKPVFLSFIDNWDSDWQASVNGNNVPIIMLFNTFKSVELKAGHNTIVFSYSPFGL
jgi:hypothetical protein